MSIQAVAWALDQDVPGRPKLVLVAVANHANHTDGYCWLRADTIGREASCSVRSVWRFVAALERNGYIRKAPSRGNDGRQRANDYWLMFNRADAPWDSGRNVDDWNDEQDEQEENGACGEDYIDPQVAAEPCASVAHGGNPPDDSGGTRSPVDKPNLSLGPCATGVTHIDSAEPSESKPKIDARASNGGLVAGPPRAYRPPPPPPAKPQGSIVADREAKQIFVWIGTPAWDAWVAYKLKTTGVRWTLTTRTAVDTGDRRTGWWFPSLFPPDEPKPTPTLSAADQQFLKRGRLR